MTIAGTSLLNIYGWLKDHAPDGWFGKMSPAYCPSTNLQVIAEPRLDAASAVSWYMAADPKQIDTIEYAYLEGQEGVYMESRVGFDVDGVELKARLDFAAKAIDWRGFWRKLNVLKVADQHRNELGQAILDNWQEVESIS